MGVNTYEKYKKAYRDGVFKIEWSIMATPPSEFREPFYESMLVYSRRKVDYQRYIELLRTGVRAGDDHAAYALSSICLHGIEDANVDWAIDTKTGLRLLRRATRSVHMAMTELASFYEGGEFGVRKSEKRAFELFLKAVAFGSVAARYHLGRCYYLGIGTRPNRRKAIALVRASVGLGFPAYSDDLAASSAP